jgi:hypothetical protein
MSLDTGRYQLYSTFKTLHAHWDQTALQWNDVVRHDFEETFWQQLEPRVNQTLAAIDRLGQIMARAKQECR